MPGLARSQVDRATRVLLMPAPERRLLLEVLAEVTRASIELRVAPRSKTASLLGTLRDSTPSRPLDADQVAEAKRIGDMIARAARHLPWHPTCLRQALAAMRMLRRRRIASELHLGVVTKPVGAAHAWVTANGQPIIGHAGLEKFVPVAAFR